MKNNEEELLNHIWSLFENQSDSYTDSLRDAAVFFHTEYNFDLEVLPEVLYAAAIKKLEEDFKDSQYDGDTLTSFDPD